MPPLLDAVCGLPHGAVDGAGTPPVLMRRTVVGLILVLAAALSALAACGSQPASESATPGFDGEERAIDTTPFTFPVGGDGTATTLNDGFFDPTTSTIILPSTTQPPATTTTTEPDLFIPPTDSITSLCGMSVSIASLFPPSPDVAPIAPEDAGPRLDKILPNLDRYVAVAPEEMRNDVIGVRVAINRLNDLYREGGGSFDYPPLAMNIRALIDNQPPYQNLPRELQSIQDYEAREC